jgi:hypothetical protein
MLCLQALDHSRAEMFMKVAAPSSRVARTNQERRRYLRYAVRCQCWLESENATVFGPTADVALGGVFLRTAVPLAEGARVQVALTLGRKAQPVVADGVVTRAVRAQHGLRHGVGVEFVNIVDGRENLRKFLGGR